ncbi:hypothetical protein J4434_01535 [Candidatus Woesearchaeota archaeon]|nr:hypothetical protein [Candidatus Woesearchaeota archaeon]
MGAYRTITLMLKGYAVGKGTDIEGYFKIQNRDIKGYDHEKNHFEISFRGLNEDAQPYFTLIHFTSNLNGNMNCTLDDVITTIDLNRNYGITEVIGKRVYGSSEEVQFFGHMLGLLKEAFPALFTQTLTIKGNKSYVQMREHLLGYPEDFKQLFRQKLEEKDTRRAHGAYIFDTLTSRINPEDWGQSETIILRKSIGKGKWDYQPPHPDM